MAPPNPIIICVMGITGTGKSTFIKEVTKQNVPIGTEMESQTKKSVVYKARLYGSDVWFMDTPGFDDSKSTKHLKNDSKGTTEDSKDDRSDTAVLNDIATTLANQYRQNLTVNGIIYLHEIKETRMRGSNSKYLYIFQKLVGNPSLTNVVLATTKWDEVTKLDGENRESILKNEHWDLMIKYGAKVRRIDRKNPDSYLSIVRELMKNMGVTLQIQEEMVNKNLSLGETSAGKVVSDEVVKATKELKEQMRYLTDELQKTKASGQESMANLQGLLEQQKTELHNELRQAARDREILQNRLQDLQTRPQAPPPQAPQPQPPQIDNGRAEYNRLRDQGASLFEQSQFQTAQWYMLQALSHAIRHFGENDPDTKEASYNVETIRKWV